MGSAKMNRDLFLLGFILYLSSTIYGLELENLCTNDHFNYKGDRLVNSVLRIKRNDTLSAISTYTIDEEIDFDTYFINKTDSDEMDNLRDEYNTLMMKIFSEDYLNNLNQDFENDKLKIEVIKNRTNDLKENANSYYRGYLDQLRNTYTNGMRLIDKLVLYRGNFLHPSIYSFGELKKFIAGLNIDEKHEIFLFKNDSISKIYKRPIKQFERFYFLPASKNFYDFRSSGKIEFSINLPFQNLNFDSKTPCIGSHKLPPFF